MRKQLVTFTVLLAAAVSGCGNLLPTKIQNVRVDRVSSTLSTISYDASRRGVFVIVKGGKEYVCPEPNPDWGTQYSSTWAANLTLTGQGNAGVGLGLPGLGSALPSTDDLKRIQSLLTDATGRARDLSRLSDIEIGKLKASVQASAGIQKTDSQVPHQLAIQSAVSVLRSGLFWRCLNEVNSGEYNAERMAKAQEDLLMAANSIVGAYRAEVLSDGAQEIAVNARSAGLDSRQTATLLKSYVSQSATPYDRASAFEREGFDAILGNDVATARRAFADAEKAYPQFHSVYEISKLLGSKRGAISAADLKKILADYSWRTDQDQLALLVTKCRALAGCAVPPRLLKQQMN